MHIKGVLTITVSNTFRNNPVYHDIMPDRSKNPHRCRNTLQQFATRITNQISTLSGNTVTATPSLFPVTDSIFVLRIVIIMSEKAVTHCKMISNDVCGYFAYLLDVDRTALSFKPKARKPYAA